MNIIKINKKGENDMKIGDTVVLNSGGPTMVINEVYGDQVECLWHNDCDSLTASNFAQKTLTLLCINLNDEKIIQVGDQVKFNTFPHTMTACELIFDTKSGEISKVRCIWFVKNSKQYGKFSPKLLTKVDEI